MKRTIQTAGDVTLLLWAMAPAPAPPPIQPPLDGCSGPPPATTASGRSRQWLEWFEELLVEHAVPQLRAAISVWRAAAGHREPAPIRFRAAVSRAKDGSADGVSSLDMAAILGAVCVDAFGWKVNLSGDHDLEVVLGWNRFQVLLELPVDTAARASRGADAGVGALHKPEHLRGALDRAMGWALVALAGLAPGQVVLDPMVGRGGVLIQAALHWPGCAHYVGVDNDPVQLASAARNMDAALRARAAAGRPVPVDLLHGDCARLPLASSSVDAVVTDMPFGRRHEGGAHGLQRLYTEAFAEMARVVRDGGTCVVFTTKRGLASRCIDADPRQRWRPVARHRVGFYGLVAYALVFRRAPRSAEQCMATAGRSLPSSAAGSTANQRRAAPSTGVASIPHAWANVVSAEEAGRCARGHVLEHLHVQLEGEVQECRRRAAKLLFFTLAFDDAPAVRHGGRRGGGNRGKARPTSVVTRSIQVVFLRQRAATPAAFAETVGTVKRGDRVRVLGHPGKTKTGACPGLSIYASAVEPLP